MKKILIINPFGIGDCLFTTPLVHSLKQAYPDSKITYLTNRRSAGVLVNNPHIENVIIYERDEFDSIKRKSFIKWLRSNLSFIAKLRAGYFDTAFDFSLNAQYGFFSWFAGIKTRIGYDFKKRGRFLTKKIPLLGYRQKHVIEYYDDLLSFVGIKALFQKPEIYPSQGDLQAAEELLLKNGVQKGDLAVGIIPGAGRSWGKEAYFKHWSADGFAEVADKVVEKYGAKIIIMGDLKEKEISASVLHGMKNKALDLTGATTLGLFAAILSKLALVITNDGGPLHMAVAVGAKTVSIFGPVDEHVYGPYPPSSEHIVVKQDLICRPCYNNFRLASCIGERMCLRNINAIDVFTAVEKLL